MTAAEIKKLFQLEQHPREGGWYIRTYESAEFIPPASLPARYGHAGKPRRTGTAIYYLLEPDTFSEMHRLKSDEIFHFYLGDPVEMLQLLPDGEAMTIILGNDLKSGQTPQLTVPHGVWQGSRLLPGGSYALLGCTVSPGFEFDDYESGECSKLSPEWPHYAKMIAQLTRR